VALACSRCSEHSRRTQSSFKLKALEREHSFCENPRHEERSLTCILLLEICAIISRVQHDNSFFKDTLVGAYVYAIRLDHWSSSRHRTPFVLRRSPRQSSPLRSLFTRHWSLKATDKHRNRDRSCIRIQDVRSDSYFHCLCAAFLDTSGHQTLWTEAEEHQHRLLGNWQLFQTVPSLGMETLPSTIHSCAYHMVMA
jgi:hypothetical protein